MDKSITNIFTVKSISNFMCKDWILNKHYARRMCSISYAFGLFNDTGELVGICTFGFPPNYNYNNGTCVFNTYRCLTLELNRLVVNDGLPKNALSYFVSNCLDMLPKPSCIVSYADPNNNHQGYIYQATNWLFTGQSSPKHKYIFEDGSTFDIRRGIDSKGKVVGKELMIPTNRYLYINANKKTKKYMVNDLKMGIYPYPKGDNIRYDSGNKLNTQMQMF